MPNIEMRLLFIIFILSSISSYFSPLLVVISIASLAIWAVLYFLTLKKETQNKTLEERLHTLETRINVMFNKEWFYYCISNECLPLYFSIKEQNDFTFNNYNDLLVKCRNIVGSVSTSQIDIPTYQDIANNIKDKLLCK